MNALGRTTVCCLVWLGLFLIPNAAAHPHCVSIGSADWIDETQSLEVALQVSAEDLEEWLSKKGAAGLVIDGKSEKAEVALKAYIQSKLQILDAENVPVPSNWIGYEVEEASAWVYLEFSFPSGTMKGCKMYHGVLIDAFDEQVNLLNIKHGKRRKTLKFRKRDPWKKMPGWP